MPFDIPKKIFKIGKAKTIRFGRGIDSKKVFFHFGEVANAFFYGCTAEYLGRAQFPVFR